MAISWSNRRKFLYSGVAAILALGAALFVYVQFFTNAPTCFDGVLNQNERGIDCGGVCSLVCRADTRPPVVLWNRVFEVVPGTYTAAAYVQNPNVGSMARGVPYTFQLFDDNNALIIERTGRLDIPPVQTVPFIDPNINVGSRTAAKAIFSFAAEPVWYRSPALPTLRTTNQYLAPDGSQLSATIVNESTVNADKVVVAAVLFDRDGVARAASRSLLSRVPRHGSQNVVFTWPDGVPNIVRAEITVLPSL